jgi:hypothetical protein
MADRWEDWFEPGERLVWEGAPEGRLRPSPGMIGAAIFGMPFFLAGLGVSAGGLFYGLGADLGWGTAGGLFTFLFGLPFVGVGAGLVFVPFYLQARAHRHVRYALSDRRAYIASRWWNRKMEVLTVAPDAPLTLENGRSVYFHTVVGTDSDGDRSLDRKGFENLSDAMAVYRLIRDLQSQRPAPA